jgi:hypothetical protein
MPGLRVESVDYDPFDPADDQLLPPPVDPRGTLGTAAGAALGNAVKNTVYGMSVPGKVVRGTTPAVPGQWSEEDQFRADQMAQAGLDWGVKTGTAIVADPLPAGLALLRGQPLRSSLGTSFGAGAGQGAGAAGKMTPALRVAIKRDRTNEVLVGEPGEIHADLGMRARIGNADRLGFVTPEGKYLSRQQAMEWVQANERLKPKADTGFLHAIDYNAARRRPFAEPLNLRVEPVDYDPFAPKGGG